MIRSSNRKMTIRTFYFFKLDKYRPRKNKTLLFLEGVKSKATGSLIPVFVCLGTHVMVRLPVRVFRMSQWVSS